MLKKFFVFFISCCFFLILLELVSILLAMVNSYKAYGNFYSEYSLTPVITDEIAMDAGYCSQNDTNSGIFRAPDGLQYKKGSVVVFGCSFAYGQYLKSNQTFSHKLSNLIKRPVYNRAIPAKGLANMYFQSTSEKLYKDVPSSDYVFFVMIEDHYRRVLLRQFSCWDNIKNSQCNYKYDNKNDCLVLTNYLLPYRILDNSYFYKIMKSFYVNKFVENSKNEEFLTNLVLAHFIKTRENLEKHWNKKFEFIVIFYTSVSYEDILSEKLKNNNFIVLNVKDLVDINQFLNSPDYNMIDGHPNEAAWDLLVPIVVNELRKQGVGI